MTLPVVFTANGPSGYNLTKSLRFRSSASAYLNRTPSINGSATTWTYSTWVKRGTLGTAQDCFLEARIDGNNNTESRFSSDDTIELLSYTAGAGIYSLKTTQVFRDPSAWYHIVIAVDTTQATSSNRIKLYVNGVQVTAFSTATYPAQNALTYISQILATQNIGRWPSPTQYFDGYMAEVNFIDGSQQAVTAFGSFNSLTGVWQPAKYTGTYGTNGFYLKFTDTTSTATLGTDYSGNSNTWTVNNISLTAGSTYDSMTDVPTLTSATAANYATLNPLMFRLSNTPAATLSNGNLTSTHTPSAYGTYVFSTIAGYGAKFYYEAVVSTLIGGVSIGIDGGLGVNSSEAARVVYQNSGGKRVNGVASSYGASYTTGDVIGVAIDLVAGSITFYKNNVSQGVASSAIGTNPYFSYGESDTGNVLNWNFGQQGFTYTPPTGFVALNTYNLTDSAILNGAKNFDINLYTGTGATQSITNAQSFQPSMIWFKSRSNATNNVVHDVLRGTAGINRLFTDTSGAEATTGDGFLSINSNGFTLDSTGTGGDVNANTRTYVAWQWAGPASGTSNTNGSITSSVAANTTAGFSVVTYTGNGSTGTVGHGLGVAPSMYIVKRLSGSPYDWYTYHVSLGNTNFIRLNTSGASATFNLWQNTTPTSSLFYLANDSGVNASSTNYVAYCWAEIAGFSKFGSYTGNGSTDGPFIYTGFRPKYVIVKRTDTGGDWRTQDGVRNPYNAANSGLWANITNAESSVSGYNLDLISNGFKYRNSNADSNASGGTYIYMAFAENPFKYSLAR